MMMKQRCGIIEGYEDWIQPKIVANALELLDKEIPKYKHKINFVHLCFSTDPFMYKQPEVIDLTLKIIARLNEDNIRCTVLTKGIFPKDLLDKEKYGVNNEYGITLVSLDEKFKSEFEPHSAPFLERVKGLRMLSETGYKTWVSMEPYPTPNLVRQNLEDLLSKISFVDKIIFGRLNYNVKSSQFQGSKGFYDDCAETVTSFCRERGIDCHIKFGTRTRKKYLEEQTKTEEIFAETEPLDMFERIEVKVPVSQYA